MLERFQKAVDMVVKTLEAHDADTLCLHVGGPASHTDATGTLFGVAAHMNNHIGQMSYLVQAFQTSTKEPPVW